MQGLLGVGQAQQVRDPAATGDPLVDWVDGILSNNGAPLTAGSAPIYGGALPAQQALALAAPYVEAGVVLVAASWMAGAGAVSPGALLLGAGQGVLFAALDGGSPGQLALGFSQGFYLAAVLGGEGEGEGEGLGLGEGLGAEAGTAAAEEEVVAGEAVVAEGAVAADEAAAVEGGMAEEEMSAESQLPKVEQACKDGCFSPGTPLLTPTGSKVVEAFRPGEWVLAGPDGDPEGAPEPRQVEKVFVRQARLLELRLGGQVIQTTAQHRFWPRGGKWRGAALLRPGDELRGHDGRWTAVEAVTDLGREATVYNLRIGDYHTYFVGSRVWGFSVWAHNSYNNKGEFMASEGPFSSAQDAEEAWQSYKDAREQLTQEGEPLVVNPEGRDFEKLVSGVRMNNDLLPWHESCSLMP